MSGVRMLSSLCFGDSAQLVGLQAADLFAFEMRARHLDMSVRRPILDLLISAKLPEGRKYDREAILEICGRQPDAEIGTSYDRRSKEYGAIEKALAPSWTLDGVLRGGRIASLDYERPARDMLYLGQALRDWIDDDKTLSDSLGEKLSDIFQPAANGDLSHLRETFAGHWVVTPALGANSGGFDCALQSSKTVKTLVAAVEASKRKILDDHKKRLSLQGAQLEPGIIHN
jgi:hypothetical protein